MPSFQRHARCAVLGCALLGLAGSPALADEDQAAREAADANTEPPRPHSQLIPTVGIGGGFTLGFGVKNAAGTGGGAVLRLAHVASRKALIAMELIGAKQFARISYGAEMSVKYPTDTTAVLAAGQYYVRPGFWLRVGAGLGSYHNENVIVHVEDPMPADQTVREAHRTFGVAGSVGAGVDIVSISHLHFGAEIMSTNLVTGEGMVNVTALLVGLSIQ